MASTKLTRTNGTPTSQQKFTYSSWVKRSALGEGHITQGFYSNSTNYNHVNFLNTDRLDFINYEGSTTARKITTAKFRDVSAWYHIVVAVDTTLGTANDRIKMYVNGVLQTVFDTNTAPSQNANLGVDLTTQAIGVGEGGSTSYLNGLMSHAHYTDGYVYDATAFGEYDANGVWKIKTSPSVTYGTNGYWILKDGNSVTDQSGNSNNFTVGGGTLTNTEDSPSNVFCTMNPLSPQTYTFSNGNNTLTRASGTSQSSAISTLATSSGKWYWELKLNSGLSDYPRVGIYKVSNADNHVYTTYPGNASGGTSKWWGSGTVTTGIIADGTGSTIPFYSYTNGDILMFAMDNDNGKVWFGKNGTWYTNNNSTTTTGSAISNNTATPAFSTVTVGETWCPVVFANASAENWSLNFGNGYFGTTAVSSAGTNASGNGIFEYDVPTGFTALSTKGLNL
jgi:hypothetical protein